MITLCVPTKNRPAFLGRLLRYYAATGYRGVVFIGDSSDSAHAMQNQRAIELFQAHLAIRYADYPGLSSCECFGRMAEAADTPYCAYVADDDVLCTPGIERCVQFLEQRREYGAAHGRGLLVQMDASGPYGAVGSTRAYPQAVLDEPTGAQRLKEFITSSFATLLYSVHRLETWREMFRDLTLMEGTTNRNIFKDELTAVCVSAIRGRVAELDGLYLIRQTHDAIYRHPSVYAWMTDAEWFPSFQIFQRRLVEELVRQDGISEDAARAVFQEVFWYYLAHVLMSSWHKRQTAMTVPPQWRNRLRAFAKSLPGVRPGVRRLRALRQRWRDPMSLPALLHPASRYHEDFMPLYQVITTQPIGFPDVRVPTGRHEHVSLAEVSAHAGNVKP